MTNNDENIVTIKFLLYCFEEMSSLKINYQKSEVVVTGAEEEETLRVANLLNCQVGALPMKYLGLPVHREKLTSADLGVVSIKLEKRLATWQYRHLSFGGRAVLINSCLCSIPSYTMGMYLLMRGCIIRWIRLERDFSGKE